MSPALVAAVLGLAGCGKISVQHETAVDLSERFHLVDSRGNKLERDLEVIRKGQRRKSLILVAPAVIRASMKGVGQRGNLRFLAAPVFDVGDGFLMMVFLRRAGGKYLVQNRYFDPGRKAEDRDWIPFTISLHGIKEDDQLEIEVTGGPQGDLTADWLAISSLGWIPEQFSEKITPKPALN